MFFLINLDITDFQKHYFKFVAGHAKRMYVSLKYDIGNCESKRDIGNCESKCDL